MRIAARNRAERARGLRLTSSADGFIATTDNKTPWSDEDWDNFKKIVKKSGNIIIGRKTYNVMNKHDGFSDINTAKVIIISSNPNIKKSNPKHIICKSPTHALQYLKQYKFNIALLSGGGILNNSFLKENLIDEIYLDIEPFVFGTGIKLFENGKFTNKLKLLNIKKYSTNGIQLHYKALKN